MISMRLLCLLLVVSAWTLPGCGYNFAGTAPVTLPQDVRMLYIRDVHNPTQEHWLDSYLRSNFQDEFTRRAEVSFVSEDQAESWIRLEVNRYSTSEELTGAGDAQVRSDIDIDLEATMFDSDTGDQIWSSGSVRGSSSFYEEPEERAAAREAVDEALRRIADGLRQDF